MCIRIRKNCRELSDVLDYNHQDESREKHVTKREFTAVLRTKQPPQLCRGFIHLHPARAVSYRENTSLNSSYNETCPLGYLDQFYTKLGKLGEGSFGEVFKVRSNEDGLLYAIKQVKVNFSQKWDRNKKVREVLRQGKIPKHDNCVELIESWEESDSLFMKLELCSTSLANFTRQHVLSEHAVWIVFHDLLKALHHIHNLDIIHLDIKLENILISKAGRCKLGDFSIAAHITEDDLSNSMEGDSRYMAPELLECQFSKAADVFSLGVVVLELSTDLVVPSRGPLWHELRSDLFPNYMFLQNGLSTDLISAITSMMSSSPEKRPTAEYLLQRPRLVQLAKTMTSEETNSEIARHIATIPPDDEAHEMLTGLGPSGGCQQPCTHRESPNSSMNECCDSYEMFNRLGGPVSSTPRRGEKGPNLPGCHARRLFD